jgi:kumamolisin
LVEEATLDVEWASALAPGAKIRIYGANENDPAENDEILQQVYADLPSQPSLHVLNICIGGNELDVPKDYLIIEAQYMANLASAGVTVLCASGDSGAVANGVVQTTYPTSDPDVTGVGGTTLVLNSDNSVASETAWVTSAAEGTGGGVSIVFSRPSWQTGYGIGVNTPLASTMRLVPDVAGPADPADGADIVLRRRAADLTIGGTSWATPVWSAFCALINQKRGAPLGLLNPLIYPLLGTSSTPSTSFRDITQGSNGTYSAGLRAMTS